MHIPTPDDDMVKRVRSGSSSAATSGIEADGRGVSGSTRRGVKGSAARRRSSVQDSPTRERKKSPPGTPTKDSGSPLATYIVDNQIRFSSIVLSLLAFAHCLVPQFRPFTQKFFVLSFYNPSTGLYGKGADDGYIVLFWIIMFTLLRAVAVDYIFIPFAKRGGISTEKGLVRFAEQAWLFVYYSVFWTLGMYLMYNSPYWLNLHEMWSDWPIQELTSLFKWYYLVQYAFWLQQIFVLNIEEKRKDYIQMFAHHIITCALMFGSYTYHMTRVGNVVLCVMDIVDILLPAAKMLKYLGYNTICDIAFVIFVITWFVGRHIFFIFIIDSVNRHIPKYIPLGCYYPGSNVTVHVDDAFPGESLLYRAFNYSTDINCFTKPIHVTFVSFLVILQIITLIWFYMILVVVKRVITGGAAEDTRSDDEGDENECKEEEEKQDVKQGLNGVKPVDGTQRNGSSISPPSLPSVIMNGGSHPRHLSSSPLNSG